MLLRLIFLLIVTYYLFKLWRKVVVGPGSSAKKGAAKARPTPQPANLNVPTLLMSCPVCGTFFQERQGISAQGILYCGAACKEKASAAKG